MGRTSIITYMYSCIVNNGWKCEQKYELYHRNIFFSTVHPPWWVKKEHNNNKNKKNKCGNQNGIMCLEIIASVLFIIVAV